jgi:hypothetical protein
LFFAGEVGNTTHITLHYLEGTSLTLDTAVTSLEQETAITLLPLFQEIINAAG